MIFILTISQNNSIDNSSVTGKLCLVDLAGSEKIEKTGNPTPYFLKYIYLFIII